MAYGFGLGVYQSDYQDYEETTGDDCPACGTENDFEEKWCSECGESLVMSDGEIASLIAESEYERSNRVVVENDEIPY